MIAFLAFDAMVLLFGWIGFSAAIGIQYGLVAGIVATVSLPLSVAFFDLIDDFVRNLFWAGWLIVALVGFASVIAPFVGIFWGVVISLVLVCVWILAWILGIAGIIACYANLE